MTAFIATPFFPLILTCLIEGLLIGILYRDLRLVYYSVLINTVTNLPLNFFLSLAGDGWAAILAGEAAVTVGEMRLYEKLTDWPRRKALAVSLALNAVSYISGVLIWALI